MNRILRLCGLGTLLLWARLTAVAQAPAEPIGANTAVPAHPRLLLLRGEETALQRTVQADPNWARVHQFILAECEQMVAAPVLERIQVGRRLLDVSRECLRRVFYLAYAWRMTGQEKYRRRAEQELLAVCAFRDWNPAHFLDVAEMTTGVALGYDWLYHDLSETTRTTIREAIVEKGLKPSLEAKNNAWLTSNSNWNQVCNAGMSFGALAVYEEQPELARRLLNRALASVPVPMRSYGPDGAFPEGYMYWGYGTTYNVLLINALEKVFGQDFGLSAQPGFLKTAAYLQHMTGPTGQPFAYSDARLNSDLQPAMFWFADKLRTPSLLWVERQHVFYPNYAQSEGKRLLPTLLLWGRGTNLNAIPPPTATHWAGGGITPVALMRTSWTEPGALFAGLKGGSPSASHAHMDVGSFVLEADGVRWSTDVGMQEYESLESKGVQLWGKQRWEVFRYTNHMHSTLTVNGQLQAVSGHAPLTGTSSAPNFQSATVELTTLYPDQLRAARRGLAIVDRRYVVVRDELQAADQAATVRWAMLTGANVKLLTPTTAELTKDGQKLWLQVTEPANITLRTWPTTPPQPYDAPNPGTTLVGFETTLPAHAAGTLTVLLTPGSTGRKAPRKVLPLAQWPQQRTSTARQQSSPTGTKR